MSNVEKFWATYERHLRENCGGLGYPWPASEAPVVATKMRAAWAKGAASKDGYAFKATCKQLGIKHTYKAINEYLAGIVETIAVLNIKSMRNGKVYRAKIYAMLDYAIDGVPHVFAVTESVEKGAKKGDLNITHVASTRRVHGLCLPANDSIARPYRDAFAQCAANDYGAKARIVLDYVLKVYGDRFRNALKAFEVQA